MHELQEDRVARGHDAVGVHRPGSRLGVVAEADLLGIGRLDGDRLGRGAGEREGAERQEGHGGHRRRREHRLRVDAEDPARVLHRTGGARLARTAAVTAATLVLGAQEQERGQATQEQSGHERGVQPGEDAAAVRDAQRQPADQVGASGPRGIDEVVVVALEDVAIALDGDDAVQDDGAQHRAAVGDDVADLVVLRGSDHREVAAVKARRHADAAGGDVARLPTDLGRGEYQPGRDRQHHERGAEQP